MIDNRKTENEGTDKEKERCLPEIPIPIIVEGRYDKSAILGMFRAKVFTTEGFGIFNSAEKQALIRRIAEKRGVILLTDSDGGGKQIRSFLSSILPADKVYQVYIPNVKGKEKRKKRISKAGMLGVEGVGGDVLGEVLSPFVLKDGEEELSLPSACLTSAELYSYGLSGGEKSSALRDSLAVKLGLPKGMNAKSMLVALNTAYSKEDFLSALQQVKAK